MDNIMDNTIINNINLKKEEDYEKTIEDYISSKIKFLEDNEYDDTNESNYENKNENKYETKNENKYETKNENKYNENEKCNNVLGYTHYKNLTEKERKKIKIEIEKELEIEIEKERKHHLKQIKSTITFTKNILDKYKKWFVIYKRVFIIFMICNLYFDCFKYFLFLFGLLWILF